jgi:hypothetical protein
LTKATKVGVAFAVVHFIAYAISYFLTRPGYGSVPLIVFWQVADFPVGLCSIPLMVAYTEWVIPLFGQNSVIAELFWAPNVADGLLGSLWWFAISKFFIWKNSN